MLEIKAVKRERCRKGGFTLLQVLLVVGILGVLSAILMGSFRRSGASAHRVECDVHLKQIALALDTFRQEKGHLPLTLNELVDDQYLQAQVLHCASDPVYDQEIKTNPKYSSYSDGYIIREPRDSQQLPIVVCPFHEKEGNFGAQAYKGGYTKQFAAHPARLPAGSFNGAVTVTRPGQGVLPLPATGGEPLLLHGGDRIRTGAGTATISFEDGSTANIEANSEMSVLQSFTEGQRGGTLYTLMRQFQGRVNYYVNPGSNFDVVTPTATAGAIGTRFTIQLVRATTLGDKTTLVGNQIETVLTVTEHTVALTTVDRTIEVTDKEPPVPAHAPENESKERKPRLFGALAAAIKETVATPIPTLLPTAIPTAIPTALPTAIPTALPTARPTTAPTATPRPTTAPTATPRPTSTPKPTATPKPKDDDDDHDHGHGND